MPKWVPVVVIIALILVGMFLTNPGMDTYAGWVAGEAITRLDDPEIVEYLQRHGPQAVAEVSKRNNFYLVSTYETKIEGVRIKAVGFFGIVVPYGISGI